MRENGDRGDLLQGFEETLGILVGAAAVWQQRGAAFAQRSPPQGRRGRDVLFCGFFFFTALFASSSASVTCVGVQTTVGEGRHVFTRMLFRAAGRRVCETGDKGILTAILHFLWLPKLM